jgi:hypothetical protein
MRSCAWLTKHCSVKTYKGVGVYIDVFLPSELIGGERIASRPGRFTSRESVPGINFIGGWVYPRASLDPTGTRSPTCYIFNSAAEICSSNYTFSLDRKSLSSFRPEYSVLFSQKSIIGPYPGTFGSRSLDPKAYLNTLFPSVFRSLKWLIVWVLAA